MPVRFASRTIEVTSATLELFHLFSRRPDWILDAALAGSIPRLWLSGLVAGAPLPGPSKLELAYIDAPKVVTVDGIDGTLALGTGQLSLVELGEGKARVAGALMVRWLGGDRTEDYPLELDLVAALVT
ncbi:MAG TPA: hypothetical protein VIU61_10855 [Kofleriaceae bacterium]